MKHSINKSVFFFFLLACSPVLSAEMRTWTSGTQTVQAEFVKFDGKKVYLKMEGGMEIDVPMAKLCQADRDYIKQAAPEAFADMVSTTIARRTSNNVLSTFKEGKWANCNAVYEHANFDAILAKDGYVSIYPKEDGNRIGNPIRFGLYCYYYGEDKGYRGRGIMQLDTDPEPTTAPDEIRLNGLLSGDKSEDGKSSKGVQFEVIYKFDKNTVSASAWVKDPNDINYPTHFRLGFGIPPSFDVPRTMTLTEQEEMMEGCQLVTKPLSGKSIVYPYHKGTSMSGAIRIATIEGDMYGSRKIKFHAKSPSSAPMHPWIYSQRAPWQGYNIFMYKKDKESKSTSQRIVITVD